jgi:transposase
MEATGVYHEHLAWHLYELDYQIHIILPFRAHRYIQSLGIKSKNDRIDAQGLADMGMQQELEPWQPCSKQLLLLRSLTRQLEMFQETKTTLTNQLEAATHLANCDKMVIRNLKSLINKISLDIEKLKVRIEKLVLTDPMLSKKYALVETIKGFGIVSFAILVAETGGFELFENQKQLVSYSGYDVIENQSGSRIGKTKISKKVMAISEEFCSCQLSMFCWAQFYGSTN